MARDDGAAQTRKAFIAQLAAADRGVHDAVCQVIGVGRLEGDAGGTARLIEAALARAQRLGLPTMAGLPDLGAVAAAAGRMSESRVAEVSCQRTGFRFFLLMASSEVGFRAVSLDARPEISDGARPQARVTLPAPEDVVSPFIPVPEEGL